MEAQLDAQRIQLKAEAEIQVAQALHELHKEIEIIKAQATLGFKTDDQEFKEKIEVFKENRKDDRIVKQGEEKRKTTPQPPAESSNNQEVMNTTLNQ